MREICILAVEHSKALLHRKKALNRTHAVSEYGVDEVHRVHAIVAGKKATMDSMTGNK